jgi:hypothetical protein
MGKYGVFGLMAGAAVLAAGPVGAKTYPGDQGQSWADIAKLPQITGIYETARMSQGTAGNRPPVRDAPPEFTPNAQAELAAYKAKGAQDTDAANCLPPGMPGVMNQPYPIQILVTPGEVTIIQEAYMQVRHVHTDGRDHPADPDLTFNGDSIGHWEGDTLVVDTVGVKGDTVYDVSAAPHSDKVHEIERIRRISPTQIEDVMTIEDPVAFTKPWVVVRRYDLKADWHIQEYVCEDNNRNPIKPDGTTETGVVAAQAVDPKSVAQR